MGRQASVLVRALGRSPYERTEQDNARVYASSQPTDQDQPSNTYVQLFDDRGHPINRSTKAAARKLRRAQNDVLFSVGVVGKNEDDQKVDEVAAENANGKFIYGIDQVLTLTTGWWIDSLRARFQTFQHYPMLPLTQILDAERSRFGHVSFYLSGLPCWLLTSALDNRQSHILQSLFELIGLVRPTSEQSKEDQEKSRRRIDRFCKVADIVLATLLVPLQMFCWLQILHIIPARALPPLRIFKPFHPDSLFGLPRLPRTLNTSTVLGFGNQFLMSPFFLFFAHDTVHHSLELWVHSKLRLLTPKPDHADLTSRNAASLDGLNDGDIPGLAQDDSTEIGEVAKTLLADIRTEQNHFIHWIFRLPRQLYSLVTTRNEPPLASTLAISEHGDLITSTHTNHWHPGHLRSRSSGSSHRLQEDVEVLSQTELTPPETTTVDLSLATTGNAEDIEVVEIISDPQDMEGDSSLNDSPRTIRPNESTTSSNANREDSRVSADSTRDPSSSHVRFEDPYTSPFSTPSNSPTLRASFLHRDPNSVILQLELTSPNNQPSAIIQLGPMFDGAYETIKAILHLRDLASDAGISTTPHNEALGRVGEMLQYLSAYEQACLNPTTSTRAFQGIVVSFHSELGRFQQIAVNLSLLPMNGALTTGSSNQVPALPPLTVEQSRSLDAETLDVIRQAMRLMPVPTSSVMATNPNFQQLPQDDSLVPPLVDGTLTDGLSRVNAPSTAALALRPRHRRPNPRHRVTSLSNFPADALASHISSLLSTLMLLPLESLFLRSVAYYYLSKPSLLFPVPSSPIIGRPTVSTILPMNVWFGGRNQLLGIKGMLSYAAAMLLLLELQECTYHIVWRFATTATVFNMAGFRELNFENEK